MKKIVCFLMSVLFTASLASCGGTEKIDYKPITGVDAIFDDSLGYNNEDPSIMQIDEYTRYVYYTRNKEKFGDFSNSIWVRKGVFDGEKYVYGKAKQVLTTSESGWDSRYTYAPTVIKGDFTYNGATYRYLMAYAGSKNKANLNNSQIGLAVGNSADGEFIKVGNAPIVEYDVYDWDVSGMASVKGASDPSLISYDLKSKVMLFYSFYSPTVSISERVLELDLSKDLNTLTSYNVLEGLLVNTSGIRDSSMAPTFLGADFAYDQANDTLYSVRDYYEIATEAPFVAEAVQIVKGSFLRAVYEIPSFDNEVEIWTTINDKINAIDTGVIGDENRFNGYDRIYSAGIVRDAFGRTFYEDKIEIIYTSVATADTTKDYAYSAMLHSFTQEL